MKLVEIKNSLAKLYYQPKESPLVLSDFLLVDDGNQKLLAQVISIESTDNENTNCAILKFSLDVLTDTFSAYNGYTPALNSRVQKAPISLIKSVFSSSAHSFGIGNLTASDNIPLTINASILDNFLYLQADDLEDRQRFFEKVAQYNNDNNKKSVILDFDNLTDYSNVKIVELCSDFKLPISNEILDYIYENDLTGLTVEQKTVVQDIILEIRDYISTLETGFIPFNTLLDVVNSVYESDKSTGIILFRNKLLKYQQLNLFASEPAEIISLINAIESNTVTVFNLSKADVIWQKEAVKFLLENVDEKLYLVANISDDNIDTKILETIYKQENIHPIISSNYACIASHQLKSLAKNLILFSPQEQQKSFASYNSFLSKLAPKEFIISGESTFYTPLIVKQFSDNFVLNTQVMDVVQNQDVVDSIPLSENETVSQDVVHADNQASVIEDEIAQDVDKFFYAEPEITVENVEDNDNAQTDELLTESDLDMLDSINFASSDIIEDLTESTDDSVSLAESGDTDIELSPIDIITDDEISIQQEQSDTAEDLLDLVEDGTDDELPGFSELDLTDNEAIQSEVIAQEQMNPIVEKEDVSIPVYKPEIDPEVVSSAKITVGNIVYHEKFGKGVVEEIFQHGSKVFCAIIFDKVGRRLLDPNVADIKQV